MLTTMQTWTTIGVFAVIMIGLVYFFTRRSQETYASFLVADRKIGFWRGGFSIAVTFIWAPAIFVSSQQSFTDGIPGIFWFMFPNFLCLLLSGWFAVKVRDIHPNGFTLTELLAERLGPNGKGAHLALLLIFFLWMLMAVVINATAGGSLISSLSGVDYRLAASAITIIAVVYSLISGMRASAFTDFLQMIFILGIVGIIVPLAISQSGGLQTLSDGIGGINSKSTNPLDPNTFYAVGILAFLGLFGGWMQDQSYYQRVFSIQRSKLVPAFVMAAFAFAIVPLALSLMGFLGAGLVSQGVIDAGAINPAMIAPEVIKQTMPAVGLIAFAFMAFAGLASTLDSAVVATGSLVSTDVYKRYINKDASDKDAIKSARIGIIAIAIIGLLISFLNPPILWLFLTYAAIAVGGLAPVIMIILGRVPSNKAVVISVPIALAISLPSAIYGNISGNVHLTVWGPILALVVSAVICWSSTKRSA